MRKTIYVNIALWLCFLVMTLPICFAASIESFTIYGKDKVIVNGVGLVGSPDTLTFEVKAVYPEDPVLGPGQVRLLEAPTADFECTAENITGRFTCLKQLEESRYTSTRFTVQLFDDLGNPVSGQKMSIYYVDNIAPTGSFSVFQRDGKTIAAFTAEDKACTELQCANLCSGFRSVEFFDGTASIGKQELNLMQCKITGEVNLSFAEAGTLEKKICMKLTDGVGHISEPLSICDNVVVDREAPKVVSAEMEFAGGGILKAVNGIGPVQARVRLTIEDDVELSNESFVIDVSAFNERDDEVLQKTLQRMIVQPVSRQSKTRAEYISAPFSLYITSPKTADIKFNVKDRAGNVLNAAESLTIGFDNTPPIVTKIYSQAEDSNGLAWVGPVDNTIFADIQEPGAGFEGMNVIMDFSSFGAQETAGGGTATNLLPNECVQNGEVWTCAWKHIKVAQGSEKQPLQLSIMSGSSDDAGNRMQGRTTGVVYYDNVAPIVFNVTMVPIPGEDQIFIPEIVSGNAVEIRAYVADVNDITAYANLTNLFDEDIADGIEGACSEFESIDPDYTEMIERFAREKVPGISGKTIYECVWQTDAVRNGYVETKIDFYFEDRLGNNATDKSPVVIYGIGNETPEGGYWDVITYELGTDNTNTRLSPSKGMDRGWWEVQSFTFNNRITIEPNRRNDVWILFLEFDPQYCIGGPGTEYLMTDEVTNFPMINMLGFDNRREKREDIITLTTNPAAVPIVLDEESRAAVTSINVTCPMFIVSLVRKGRVFEVSPVEIYNTTIVIPVFNNPLGQNLGNVQDHVKELEDDVFNEHWDRIRKIEQFFQYAEKVCSVIGMIYGFTSILSEITDVIEAAGDAAKAAGGAGEGLNQEARGISREVEQGDKYLEDTIGDLYPTLCGMFVQCRVTREKEFTFEADCEGWCKIKKAWQKINSWYAGEATKILDRPSSVPSAKGGEGTKPIFNQQDFDPKQSIISSVLTACIPGIIYNLQKIRAIKCKKIICLKTEVPQSGVTLKDCEERYATDQCTLWVGQVFSAIPITQYAHQVTELLKDVIADPFVLISYGADVFLKEMCDSDLPGYWCYAGMIAKWGSDLISQVVGVVNFAQTIGDFPPDMCEAAKKLGSTAGADSTPATKPAAEEPAAET